MKDLAKRVTPYFKFWYLAFLVAGILVGIFAYPSAKTELGSFEYRDFSVNFSEESWRVYYGDLPADKACPQLGEKCPAHKDFDDLWRGQIRLGWEHADKIRTRQELGYWIGHEISIEEQLSARKQGADRLFVGMFQGRTEVYVDGVVVYATSQAQAREPVIMPIEIPEEPIGPIYLAVRVVNHLKEPFPDRLRYSGLASADQIRAHLRSDIMNFFVKRSAAAGFSLAVGIFLLTLFIGSPRKQEIGAFAAFAFVHAAVQAAQVPFAQDFLGRFNWHQLNFVVVWYEGLFALMVALSISRIRMIWTRAVAAGLVLLPWTVLWSPLSSIDIYYIVQQDLYPFSYVCYFAAAGICLGQAVHVYNRYLEDLQDRMRVPKLALAAIGLVVMGVAQIYENYGDQSGVSGLCLALLSAAVVHEYQRQELQLRRTLISKYHLRAKLPDSLQAVLVGLDIKGSENLEPNHAQRAIDAISQLILRTGGEILQVEGDAILFAFVYTGEKAPLGKVFEIISECEASIRSHDVKMHFRSAMSTGEIKPIWQEFLGQKRPAWVNAGEGSNAFVAVARLLEAEKKVVHEPKTTLIGDRTFPANTQTTVGQVEIKHGRLISYELFEFSEQRKAA